jgi:hypothetical protein
MWGTRSGQPGLGRFWLGVGVGAAPWMGVGEPVFGQWKSYVTDRRRFSEQFG